MPFFGFLAQISDSLQTCLDPLPYIPMYFPKFLHLYIIYTVTTFKYTDFQIYELVYLLTYLFFIFYFLQIYSIYIYIYCNIFVYLSTWGFQHVPAIAHRCPEQCLKFYQILWSVQPGPTSWMWIGAGIFHYISVSCGRHGTVGQSARCECSGFQMQLGRSMSLFARNMEFQCLLKKQVFL